MSFSNAVPLPLTGSAALNVSEVCKAYRLYARPEDRLKQFFFGKTRQYFQEFWALQPLSFELQRGECLGFVGRNGSGKSTLLQILAGTLTPNSGAVERAGRLSALLELGAGFNPEFSGRENVLLNAAILGLTRSEIKERMPAIEAFAELGDFIDRPVRTYSSGMYVRLAFSVAIHVDPEILLIDEALAVGDLAFQYKCLRRLDQLKARGLSIIFVTHDIQAVRQFCDRAGWLDHGNLRMLGEANKIVDQYEDFMRQFMRTDSQLAHSNNGETEISAPQHARILQARLLHSNTESKEFKFGDALKVEIQYEVLHAPPDGLILGVAIFRGDDLYVCGLNTGLDQFSAPATLGRHTACLHYPNLSLLSGSYYLKLGIFDKRGMVDWDFRHKACPFQVSSPYIAEGVFVMEHRWEVQ